MRTPLRSTVRPALALGTVLLLTSLTAASCEDTVDVTVAEVGRATVSEVVDAPASVTARAAATLTAPADGTLASLPSRPASRSPRARCSRSSTRPPPRTRLRQAKQALDAAKRSGGGGGAGRPVGRAAQLDAGRARRSTHARDAAEQIADPRPRAALLAHSHRRGGRLPAGFGRGRRGRRRGAARRGERSARPCSALGAAQRLQAQQAYDLAKATVDALTLRAPIAGVVQLGGTSSARRPART